LKGMRDTYYLKSFIATLIFLGAIMAILFGVVFFTGIYGFAAISFALLFFFFSFYRWGRCLSFLSDRIYRGSGFNKKVSRKKIALNSTKASRHRGK